jgi:hypothetical protein
MYFFDVMADNFRAKRSPANASITDASAALLVGAAREYSTTICLAQGVDEGRWAVGGPIRSLPFKEGAVVRTAARSKGAPAAVQVRRRATWAEEGGASPWAIDDAASIGDVVFCLLCCAPLFGSELGLKPQPQYDLTS